MLGTGRGELLMPVGVDLKGYYLVIFTPGIHISTEEAYAGVIPGSHDNSVQLHLSAPMTTWKETLNNDFEPSIFRKHPIIQAIKSELYSCGAIYASMSGSGSSIFGIFEKETVIEGRFKDVPRWSGWL